MMFPEFRTIPIFAILVQSAMTKFILIEVEESLENVDKIECPKQQPDMWGKCSGNVTCTYGEECCCGKCHPSLEMMCDEGKWTSFYTDACMGAGLRGCEFCKTNQDCTAKQRCVNGKCVEDPIVTKPKCPKCCAKGCYLKHCGNPDICPPDIVHFGQQTTKEWKKIGAGVCEDAFGSSFNDLENNWKGSCQYDIDECKEFCEQMGEACVGIVFYPNGNESSCSLNLRNGITQEDAKKLVPKFCSHVVFNNFSYGYSSTGGVVKADGNSDYVCWAHRILGSAPTLTKPKCPDCCLEPWCRLKVCKDPEICPKIPSPSLL